jgi:ectoine hydroxylase-related dioxygenase (phytanoyl-CoA dioxygenase family)
MLANDKLDRSVNHMRAQFEQRGYAKIRRLVDRREVAAVARALEGINLHNAGTRNLLETPWCRALVQRIKRRLEIARLLQSSHVAVQCTLFDKTPTRNWLVAMHQDLSIPVRSRVDHPSFRAWSKKEGTDFLQPPPQLLEQLVAARLHIDDCGLDSGPLKVVPGSHRGGRLSESAAIDLRAQFGEEHCLAASGDTLLMRPLLLHASSKAHAPSRRRVLHVLFGPPVLPHGLEWRHVV